MSESNPSFIVVNNDSIDDKKHMGCIKLDVKKHHKYWEYIGKLMYLMVCTRPNIAFTVNFLARACALPEKRHMGVVQTEPDWG